MYEQLVEESLLQGDVTIVELDDLKLDSKEMLIEHGIRFDEIITFQRLDNIKRGGGKEVTPAHTSFYMVENQPKAVVFITKALFPDKPEWNELFKYLFLIHELAHVQDFRNCNYINWQTKKSNLLKAEIYAEIYTLKFLSHQKDDEHKLCRSIYASRLIDFQHSENELNQNVLKGVSKKIPMKKLKQWAK